MCSKDLMAEVMSSSALTLCCLVCQISLRRTKISIIKYEEIMKKVLYESCAYESVDDRIPLSVRYPKM